MKAPIVFDIFLAILTLFNTSYAQSEQGICSHGKETLPSLSCSGYAILKETTIEGNTSVSGPLRTSQSMLHTVQVAGIIEMHNSIVNGDVTVAGPLTATYSQFEKNVTIASDRATFNHSAVKGNVTMGIKNKTPVLELLCRSEVTGAVVFKGEPGIVRMTKDSAVRGKVINGTTETVKVTC